MYWFNSFNSFNYKIFYSYLNLKNCSKYIFIILNGVLNYHLGITNIEFFFYTLMIIRHPKQIKYYNNIGVAGASIIIPSQSIFSWTLSINSLSNIVYITFFLMKKYYYLCNQYFLHYFILFIHYRNWNTVREISYYLLSKCSKTTLFCKINLTQLFKYLINFTYARALLRCFS